MDFYSGICTDALDVGCRLRITLTAQMLQQHVAAWLQIVPPLQVMDGVMQSTIQCGITPGYYYTGKHPALAFDTAVPFGMSSRHQIAWMYHGGGLDLLNAIYSDFGLITFPVSSTGAQMGGWFREPIGGLSDLAGLRMRIPGFGGEIMSRMGVTVQVRISPESKLAPVMLTLVTEASELTVHW